MTTVKPISKTLAEKALKAVKEQFASWIEPGYEPKLIEAWTESGHWVIVWEEGALYEWTILAEHGGNDIEFGIKIPAATDFPSRVFAEPINGCVLGLYPNYEY